MDIRFCSHVSDETLRYTMVFDSPTCITHKKAKRLSGVEGDAGFEYFPHGPQEELFASLTKRFVSTDLPKLMPALGLKSEQFPLWWTADFIDYSSEGRGRFEELAVLFPGGNGRYGVDGEGASPVVPRHVSPARALSERIGFFIVPGGAGK